MPKFDPPSRVMFRHEGRLCRGRVTAIAKHQRRVVTDTGRRLVVPVRRLRDSPDRVLILETRLDRSLRSRRFYAEMLRQWFSAYKVEALHDRVHTVEGLRRFLHHEGRSPTTRFVHIIGHGKDLPGVGTATLDLTFEKLDLVKHADVFEGLDGKIIVFSCCEIGADLRAMKTVKKASGAAAVLGYRYMVEDTYTNVAEALLYDRLISTPQPPAKVVKQVGDALKMLGIKPEDTAPRKPVLVAV